ncbi:MAG: hypothetical protein LBQ60_04230 [Bacteroidales bacterium]|jgi:hypothetical protein|nr:hypothetical protein [Bacteroidales bacterium]
MNKYILLLVAFCSLFSCKDDDPVDPYIPVNLPSIQKITFTEGQDSSIFVYDQDMRLLSGKCKNFGGMSGEEKFTVHYSDQGHLAGAKYEVLQGSRYSEFSVNYSLNDRNMLSGLTREDWTKSLSFSYDEHYRLVQLTVHLPQNGINRYTISYDDQSNVSSVELYLKIADVEGYTKTEYDQYDGSPNPFSYLVNVFYAPVFSSNYGPVRYDALSLGMLLSANNPGKITEYRKEGEAYVLTSSTLLEYTYADDRYPVEITGDSFSLKVGYHP